MKRLFLIVFQLFFYQFSYAHFPDPVEHVLHKEKFISFGSEFAEFNYSGYKGNYLRNIFIVKYPLMNKLDFRAEVPFVLLNREDKTFIGLGDIIPGIKAEIFHNQKVHLNAGFSFETPTGKVGEGIGAGHLSLVSALDLGYRFSEVHSVHGGIDIITGLWEHENHKVPVLVHPHSEPEILLHLGNSIKLSEAVFIGGGLLDEFQLAEKKHYISCSGFILIGKKYPISVNLRAPLRNNDRFNWSIQFQIIML